MKSAKEWRIEQPVEMVGVTDRLVKKIQNNAYNQCLFDLRKDEVLLDTKQNLIKYWKDED